MDKNSEILKEWLINNNINYFKDYKISLKSWIKAGGIIKNYIIPETINDCQKLIRFLKEKKIRFYILGNISNTIIRDGIINAPFININKLSNITDEKHDDGYKYKVSGGTSLPKFSKFITKNGITGCEGLVGIPGTVGGGVFMNCSSYGSCISDYIISIECITPEGDMVKLNKDEGKFEFRKSIFQLNNYLILNVYFLFPAKNLVGKEKALSKLKKIIEHRNKFQEKFLPNLGSLFATKDLYRDLKNKNIIFFLLYFFHKTLSIIILNFSNKRIFGYRKFIVGVYEKFLRLDKKKKYSLSNSTINCLVNNGSESANDAIEFIRDMKKKISNCADLENIILDDIK